MQAITINSEQWTQFTIPANTNFALITQEQSVCYYAEQDNPTDYIQFKEIVGNFTQTRDIWLKTQYGESVVLYLVGISTIGGFGGNGGGGGATYTFNAPIEETGGSVSLNLASDLQIRSGNLTLKLTSNQDFMQLAQLVQSLTSGIEWVGKATITNAQAKANHQLLSDYVVQIQGRQPKVGDLVLTSDTPPYGWIYTNTYDPASGQVTGQDWDTIGTTAVSIATQNTVGLVKGSSTIQIGVDGSASVDGVVLLDTAQTIAGVKTFTDGLTSNANITISKASPTIAFYDTIGNKQALFGTIDNGQNLAFTAPSGGAIQFNGTLRYIYTAVPTVTNNNEIPSLGQIKSQFAGLSTANTFTQTQTFNTIVFGERLRYTASSMSLAPSTNRRGTIWLTDGSVGSDCVSDLNLANAGKIINCPNPTNPTDASNKRYVDTATGTLTSLTTTAKDNLVNAINEINAGVSSKADDNAVVKLSGNQSVGGVKTFTANTTINGILTLYAQLSFTSQVPRIAPPTNTTGTIYMGNGQVGADCYYNLQFENKGQILGLKDGINDSDGANIRNIKNFTGTLSSLTTQNKTNLVTAINELVSSKANLSGNNTFTGNNTVPTPASPQSIANKQYVDNTATKILPAGTTPTTADIGVGQVGYVLRS